MREGVPGDNFPADEMLLDDLLQHFRRAAVIPHALGIDNGNGAAYADAQAVGACAEDEGVWADEAQFLEARLEEFPRGGTRFAWAAFGIVGVHAEEDVAAIFFKAKAGNGGL